MTVREKVEMAQGEEAILYKKIAYHEDISKFGKLGIWILSCLGLEDIELEDLIGDIPGTTRKTESDLSEEEKELLQFAKENGLKYKITSQGLKISN